MARIINNLNVVIGIHESGTYAGSITGSTFWIGQVQSHSTSESEGLIEQRFLGQSDRNFDRFIQGPRDVTGTLTYNPSDMRILFWSIGSTRSVSGTNGTFAVQEVEPNVRLSPYTSGALNPPISFAIEDTKVSVGTGQNFKKTIRGIVPNVTTLSATQGEKVLMTVDYIGQTLYHGSSANTSFVEITRSPYVWNHVSMTLAGSSVDTAKSVEFVVDNSREAPHYLNGSRDISVPFDGNRNYTVSLTQDLDGIYAERLYRNFYLGGSTFNMTLDLNADNTGTSSAGSQHTILYMSGCYIIEMPVPSELEGTVEATLTIRPQTVTGSEFNAFLSGGIYGPF